MKKLYGRSVEEAQRHGHRSLLVTGLSRTLVRAQMSLRTVPFAGALFAAE